MGGHPFELHQFRIALFEVTDWQGLDQVVVDVLIWAAVVALDGGLVDVRLLLLTILAGPFDLYIEDVALVGSTQLEGDVLEQALVVTVVDHVVASQTKDPILPKRGILNWAQFLKEVGVRLLDSQVLVLVQQLGIDPFLIEARETVDELADRENSLLVLL